MVAAGLTLALQVLQPFMPLVLWLALAGDLVWRSVRRRAWPARRSALILAACGAVQAPLLLYSATLLNADPIWRAFALQNQTPSPHVVYYLLGVGPAGLLAAWGGWLSLRRRSNRAAPLIAWVLVASILLYAPTQFQRRFSEGLMAPLAILAALAVGRGLLPRLRRVLRRPLRRLGYPYRRARGSALALLAVAAMPSTLYLVFGGALLAGGRPPHLFDSAAVVQAADWLGGQGDAGGTVLAAEATGSLLPARAGVRVLLGHPIETIDYERKSLAVTRFFDPAGPDAARHALLAECHCRWVFHGPAERALGDYDPAGLPGLRPAFAAQGVAVYAVMPGD